MGERVEGCGNRSGIQGFLIPKASLFNLREWCKCSGQFVLYSTCWFGSIC